MGSVQQAVLEFDEEIQAPWRPRLVVVASAGIDAASTRAPVSYPNRRSPSRVGVCRPPAPPAAPGRRPTLPRPQERLAGSTDGARHPVAHGPRPAGSAAPAVRLTARARRLAGVMALAAGVAVGSWLGPLVAGDAGGLRLAGESTVVVQSGDTLWSIASSLGAGDDVRAVVHEIQELNRLSGAELMPGQRLLLP